MKKTLYTIAFVTLTVVFAPGAFAHDGFWKDASGDRRPKSFSEGYSRKMKHFKDGVVFFPGAELGLGSGALSASLGVNAGYKSGLFFIGTSLRGQIVNIDKANYQFVPYTINICGLSYSAIPETSNSVNDRKLKGWSIGYAMGGKLTFSQLIETDPKSDTDREYLQVNFGIGF